MNGEEGVKAAFDFLHAMRKIETLPPTTQEEIDAIKDGILNMACIPDEPEGLYMVETAELPEEHQYGEDVLKILYREEQAKRSDAEQDAVNQIIRGVDLMDKQKLQQQADTIENAILQAGGYLAMMSTPLGLSSMLSNSDEINKHADSLGEAIEALQAMKQELGLTSKFEKVERVDTH